MMTGCSPGHRSAAAAASAPEAAPSTARTSARARTARASARPASGPSPAAGGGRAPAAAGCAALVVVSHCHPDDEHGEVLVHDVLAPALRAARGAPHWDVCAHVCGDDSACCYIARARARPHATRARARGEQPGRATFRVLAHGDSDDDDDDDNDDA